MADFHPFEGWGGCAGWRGKEKDVTHEPARLKEPNRRP